MANISDAVSQAARLGEVRFADFTAQLVREVFEAILQTNVAQTQSYLDIVERVSQSLATFISTSKDGIGAASLALGAIP